MQRRRHRTLQQRNTLRRVRTAEKDAAFWLCMQHVELVQVGLCGQIDDGALPSSIVITTVFACRRTLQMCARSRSCATRCDSASAMVCAPPTAR